jgi:acyl-CoA thioesterase-1
VPQNFVSHGSMSAPSKHGAAMKKLFRPFWLALTAVVFVTTASLGPALTEVHASAALTIQCSAPAEMVRLDHPLDRTQRRLAAGLPLTIVAVGSSSTAGAGASSPDHSYPSQLAVEFQQLFPGHPITVLNRGVNGEEAADMLARLDRTVLAEKPDLVLWQVGTNDALRDSDLQPVGAAIHEGLARLKASGADVILIDPQFAPQTIAKAETKGMVNLIASLAKQDNVDLFRRFAVMQNWSEASGIPFTTFVSPDNLHMNDWGYGCVAKILGHAIADAASRPILTATTITPLTATTITR